MSESNSCFHSFCKSDFAEEKEDTIMDIIEEYILSRPQEVQGKLFELKAVIEKHIPNATKRMAWQMPTYTIQKKNIIHFAVHKKHIGVYLGKEPLELFKDQIEGYTINNSALHIKFEDKIPEELLCELMDYNIKEA